MFFKRLSQEPNFTLSLPRPPDPLQVSVWEVFSISKAFRTVKLDILSNRNVKSSYVFTFSKNKNNKK